ncbi:MAG: glycosyltransferase [Desulfotomaculaceae bacterium]
MLNLIIKIMVPGVTAIRASVIIPAYNCRQVLEKSLAAILNQTVESSVYEVIVVDDGSSDDTVKMVNRFKRNNLLYLRQEHSGRSKARNLGIAYASGEVIIFIDSDVVVCRSFVEGHLLAHAGGAVIARGRVVNIPEIEKQHNPGLFSGFSAASFPTCNCSARKESLIKAGLFDEEFTEYGWEDLELGHRLMKMGSKKVKAGQAVGFHLKPPLSYESLAGQMQKELERGRTAVLYYRKSPTIKTRLSTLYAPPFLLLESLLNIAGWPERPYTLKFLKWLDGKGYNRLFRFISGFRLLAVYFKGMREADLAARPGKKS